MFSGIIKYTGSINKIYKKKRNFVMEIYSKIKFSKDEIGSSISCSGACLTLEKINGNLIKFFVSMETVKRTNFKFLRTGCTVNLEKSLKYGKRISGHFVQGHIDTTCKVKKIYLVGKSWVIDFILSNKHKKYVVEKGSIAINGISLTISRITHTGFQVVVIPQTLKFTNLMNLKNNGIVNIEFDVLGKYMMNFLK